MRLLTAFACAALCSCASEPEAPVEAPEVVDAEEASAPDPDLGEAQELAALKPSAAKEPSKSPFAGPATEDTDRALKILRGVVHTWGRSLERPWAVGHALLATGPDLTLDDGRVALDALVAEYAEVRVMEDGAPRVTFPQERDGRRVETHTELFLKVFTEIGIDPERAFEVQGRAVTARELWLSALARSFIDPKGGASYATPNDVPWSLQALTAWSDGKKLVWRTDDGHEMSLDFLADFVLAVLEKETGFLKQARAARATFQKRGQDIFQYTCGGAHLLQGAGFALARGYGTQRGAPFMQEQIALHFYRLPRELQIYDDALRTYGQSESYKTATAAQRRDIELRVLVQRLKFLGHWLETTHKFGALSLFYADKDGAMAMLQARRALALLVETLEAQGIFGRLDEIQQQDEQLFLDIIGDAAHAIVALELATGVRSVQP